MTMELYQEVALTRDLPEYGLKSGKSRYWLILSLIRAVVKKVVSWKSLMRSVNLLQ
jgi:hypothetical protein